MLIRNKPPIEIWTKIIHERRNKISYKHMKNNSLHS